MSPSWGATETAPGAIAYGRVRGVLVPTGHQHPKARIVPRGHAPDTWPELRPCWAPARGSQFMAFKMYSSQKYQSWTPGPSS